MYTVASALHWLLPLHVIERDTQKKKKTSLFLIGLRRYIYNLHSREKTKETSWINLDKAAFPPLLAVCDLRFRFKICVGIARSFGS
jgi:hypothetical protein